MFEAFRVGITIALTNQVSGVLGMVARDFAKTDAAAVALKSTLKEIAFLGAGGALLGGLGYAGFRAVSALVKPASEYAHQLNIINMAGLSQVDVAQAVAAAWKNTGDVLTTTATSNLKSLLDLRNVLTDSGFQAGDPVTMKMATDQLAFVTKMQAVLAASKEGALSSNAADFAFSMAKALDLMGAVDPASFVKQGEAMGKVITAFQGRVSPQMYQSVFQYARQGRYDLSDEFKYELGLPTLMLEMARSGGNSQGGGSRGVGPGIAAMYRFTQQGRITKQAIPLLTQLGLLTDQNFAPAQATALPGDPNFKSSAQTMTSSMYVGHLKDAQLAGQNPFLWTVQDLVPAIQKAFPGASLEQERSIVGTILAGNQQAASLMMEFITKPGNFYRDAAIIQGAMPVNTAYQQAMFNDPTTAYAALSAQWENVKTAFGMSVVPIIVPALIKLAGALSVFGQWAEAHPDLTAGLTYGFIALSASLAFAGTVLVLTAAFKVLSLAFSVFGVAIPSIIGLTGAMGGFMAAMNARGFLGAAMAVRGFLTAIGPIGAALGAAALGFARIAGPLGIIVAALSLLGPSKSFQEAQDEALKRQGLTPDAGTGARLGAWWHGLWSGLPNLSPIPAAHASLPVTAAALPRLDAATLATGRPMTGSPHPSLNNPLNLRVPGSHDFRTFGTLDQGIMAAAAQLRRDQDVHGLNTISEIIGDPKWGWAPASDGNDDASYIRDVGKQTGFGPNQKLDLGNPDVLSRLEAAMAHHEGSAGVTLAQVVDALSQIKVHMDGEPVGRIVSNYQASQARQPPTGTGDYDLGMTPAFASFGMP